MQGRRSPILADRATTAHGEASSRAVAKAASVVPATAKRDTQDALSSPKFIRFDWAIKSFLRDKADRSVLNGFLTSLLGEKVRIDSFLESEGNKAEADARTNRVDILATDSQGAKIIIEIQNTLLHDYFHRMLFGVSKVVTDYIKEGEPYASIKKIYSINIVYFELGQGVDYVYRGTTIFRGLHRTDDILGLSVNQRERFKCEDVCDIFPVYYVLRVENFYSDVTRSAKDMLDQWIYFLKTSEIPQNFNAPGLPEAREQLRIDRLPQAEKLAYKKHLQAVSDSKRSNSDASLEGYAEGREEGRAEGRAEGREEGKAEAALVIARELKADGFPVAKIAKLTKLPLAEVEKLS